MYYKYRYKQIFHAWFASSIKSYFMVFLSDFVEITSCVYTKTIILFNPGEQWL